MGNPNIGKLGKNTQFKVGNPGSPGYPTGLKNRSTIAKKVLEMTCALPEQIFEKIKEIYPDIEKRMSTEEIATIVQITNAITKGDTAAYRAIMDSAYGAPAQQVDHSMTENKKLIIKINRNEDNQIKPGDPISLD